MTLKIILKHSQAAVSGVATPPVSTDLETGELGLNYVNTDPALYILDSAGAIRKLNAPPNRKFSLDNNDPNLVGGDTTTAINTALAASSQIGGVGTLLVSDQVQVVATGNPDTNPEVPAGRYFYDGTVWFESSGSAGASVEISDTAPTGANEGDLWWDSGDTSALYIWYTDNDSSQWVPATPNSGGEGGGASVTTSEDPPAGASEGDMWWDSSDGADSNGGRLYLYYDGQWVQTSNVGGDGGGGGGGVEQLIAGNNITLTPADGKGVVTVNSTGGPGGVNYQGASAWGVIKSDGTVAGNYNIASCTTPAVGQYDVVFSKPLSTDSYAVNVSANSSQDRNATVGAKTVNGFTVFTFNNGGGGFASEFQVSVFASNAIAPPSGVGADAWGAIAADGTSENGFNYTVSKTTTGTYQVSFIQAMPSDTYAITQSTPSTNNKASFSSQDKNGFIVACFALSTGTKVDGRTQFAVHASSTVTPTYTWTRDGTTLKPANDGDDVEIAASVKTSYLDITANPIQTTGNLIKINGVSEGSTTIGYDGSATFASTVSIKGGVDSSSATNNGILINEIGTVGIQRSSTSSVSATSFYTYRGTTRTSAIKLNGDAEFAGKVTASNVTFSLESDNVANFSAEGEYTGPTLDVKELLLKLVTAADRIEALEETNASLEARLSALEGGSY